MQAALIFEQLLSALDNCHQVRPLPSRDPSQLPSGCSPRAFSVALPSRLLAALTTTSTTTASMAYNSDPHGPSQLQL